MQDKFQCRYLKHQEEKTKQLAGGIVEPNKYTKEEKKTLIKVLTLRKSRRVFSDKLDDTGYIKAFAGLAPSSCNRHGVYFKEASDRLVGLLVGGKGWADKGTVLAFYADMNCYKSPYEKTFMPYLDTGFMAQNIYLICEVLGLGCCFINPNTHNKYKSKHLLTGAVVIGKL